MKIFNLAVVGALLGVAGAVDPKICKEATASEGVLCKFPTGEKRVRLVDLENCQEAKDVQEAACGWISCEEARERVLRTPACDYVNRGSLRLVDLELCGNSKRIEEIACGTLKEEGKN